MKRLVFFVVAILFSATCTFAGSIPIPCKFTRADTPCEKHECPAIIVNVDEAGTSTFDVPLFNLPLCLGDPVAEASGDVKFPKGDSYIIYTLYGSCALLFPTYSAGWTIDDSDPICVPYVCGVNVPDCDDLSNDPLLAFGLDSQ